METRTVKPVKADNYTIFFVGAGPGDPELLTIKGRKALEEAGLVLYAGSLVNPLILDFCGEGCVRADSSGLTLEEQTDLMTDAAGRGLKVVRLHTGDPSLFGAVAEQKKLLEDRGLAVRFIPGVSSLQAAAASLGIQYTVPGGSQTVICTRRKGRTPVPPKEDIRLLAASGATMVIFLSTDQAEAAAADLMAGGFSPDAPAACVYRASWEDEKIIRSPLAELPALMKEQGITRHALIIAGECLGEGGERSLLYSPHFSHGFREGAE